MIVCSRWQSNQILGHNGRIQPWHKNDWGITLSKQGACTALSILSSSLSSYVLLWWEFDYHTSYRTSHILWSVQSWSCYKEKKNAPVVELQSWESGATTVQNSTVVQYRSALHRKNQNCHDNDFRYHVWTAKIRPTTVWNDMVEKFLREEPSAVPNGKNGRRHGKIWQLSWKTSTPTL